MHVGVRIAAAQGATHSSNWPGATPCGSDLHVRGGDGSGDDRWRGRAGLSARRSIVQVRAQERGDSSDDALLPDMDMRLLHVAAFQIGVGEFVLDRLPVLADPGLEGATPAGRYGRHLLHTDQFALNSLLSACAAVIGSNAAIAGWL